MLTLHRVVVCRMLKRSKEWREARERVLSDSISLYSFFSFPLLPLDLAAFPLSLSRSPACLLARFWALNRHNIPTTEFQSSANELANRRTANTALSLFGSGLRLCKRGTLQNNPVFLRLTPSSLFFLCSLCGNPFPVGHWHVSLRENGRLCASGLCTKIKGFVPVYTSRVEV
ncbi:hypothetical protein H113_04309 [Trichophyton rubrum MR1459]|nr:uncharacterized protein TERG_04052 [Trichophyton rubrum CBS 118892]EZF95241.1 hypothetical protein H113_04309 [Trichophyton rubrum MR1459]EZG06314.1 hypothetical protein H106_04093 [Trichophyton rubrum CBS 735.88]KFL61450.1 hypothetical protein TERG_04052 [Trichophyton rubrum CBS 118892]